MSPAAAALGGTAAAKAAAIALSGSRGEGAGEEAGIERPGQPIQRQIATSASLPLLDEQCHSLSLRGPL